MSIFLGICGYLLIGIVFTTLWVSIVTNRKDFDEGLIVGSVLGWPIAMAMAVGYYSVISLEKRLQKYVDELEQNER